jgi:hypothetical protein
MAAKQTKKRERTPVEQVGQRAGNLPAAQREDDYKVGPGNPPKEYQFQPGESGNPKGNVKHRTNLWTYFAQYMAMTDAEIAHLDKKELTQAQHTALNLVKRIKAGEKVGSTRMARYIVDREEGKAAEHLILDNGADLSDEECDELRKLIQGKHAGDGRDSD